VCGGECGGFQQLASRKHGVISEFENFRIAEF